MFYIFQKQNMKKKTLLIFSYGLLHSFFLPPGTLERKTFNSISVAKQIIGGLEISRWEGVGAGGGSIKVGDEIFRGFDLLCLL